MYLIKSAIIRDIRLIMRFFGCLFVCVLVLSVCC